MSNITLSKTETRPLTEAAARKTACLVILPTPM